MSSSSVFQGLQSCLESRLMEPRVLKLKLTPSKSNFSGSIPPSPESQSHVEENTATAVIIEETNNQNDDSDMKKSEKTEDMTSGWSFLQCLTTTNTKERDDDDDGGGGNDDKVYIHPLDKRSSSVLSEKSLEMCTESLGSETGSSSLVSSDDDDDDDDDGTLITTISSSPEITTTTTRQELMRTKRNNRSSVSFPPPLTSSSGVQVMRPHREGGRLVLQAVTVSSSPTTYFHAERSDGRLRLCLVKEDLEEEEEEEEFDDEDEDFCDDCDEDTEDKKGKVRDEIGMENLAMASSSSSSRCKEGGRGAGNKLIWEPFWVAT